MVDFTMKRWPTKKHQMQKVTKREREGKEVVSSTLDGLERILLRGYIFRLATMDALDALFVHFHEFHMTWYRNNGTKNQGLSVLFSPASSAENGSAPFRARTEAPRDERRETRDARREAVKPRRKAS